MICFENLVFHLINFRSVLSLIQLLPLDTFFAKCVVCEDLFQMFRNDRSKLSAKWALL